MGKRQRISDEISLAEVQDYKDSDQPNKRPRRETKSFARRTLFVRSLPAVATSESLTEFFSQNYPLKHATVVIDPETRQSKGYGFVTFADAEDALKAKEYFNGNIFLGRKIKIEVAEPRSRYAMKGEGLDGKWKNQISEEAATVKKARIEKMAENKAPPKLIIRNLPWSIESPEQLAQLFQKFGKVKFSTLPKIRDNTQAGFGFVTMRGRKNAEKAMASLNGILIDGRTVAVDWAVDKEVWQTQKNDTTNTEEGMSDKGFTTNPSKDSPEHEKFSTESTTQEQEDVSNFFKTFGDQLESEDEDAELLSTDDSACVLEQQDIASVQKGDEDIPEKIEKAKSQKTLITDNSTTLFIRNLPFTTLDPDLKEQFEKFGPVRYARVVLDHATGRPKGTGFVCFYNIEDADSCYHGAPRSNPTGANAMKLKQSILEDEGADKNGMYSIGGRVLQVSRAVDRENANKLTENGSNYRIDRDKDKRKLFLLSEGTVAAGTPLYESLSPSEIKMREDSATQRKKLIQNNPTLHVSLTRLSVRNLPRNINSKDLKAMARQAVVGFATDVKAGLRAQLSREEEARGGEEDRLADQQRKAKGRGIVRQAKVVFEGREGYKISEDSGGGRSRGYGFVEYHSHRWALMGLRWLNGHAVENASGNKQKLIVEFAIENAQVVQRRKEAEEKARLRSQEVLKARARGEIPEKKNKILKKDQVMAKIRKGMKGKTGRPEVRERSFNKVVVKSTAQVSLPENRQRKADDCNKKGGMRDSNKQISKRHNKKSELADKEDGMKVVKKIQIIQRKRQLRKERRLGATK